MNELTKLLKTEYGNTGSCLPISPSRQQYNHINIERAGNGFVVRGNGPIVVIVEDVNTLATLIKDYFKDESK